MIKSGLAASGGGLVGQCCSPGHTQRLCVRVCVCACALCVYINLVKVRNAITDSVSVKLNLTRSEELQQKY